MPQEMLTLVFSLFCLHLIVFLERYENKGMYCKNYGFVMYEFRSKLVCFLKPMKVTEAKQHFLTTKSVNFMYITKP
jgi:hypothetical protein